jgi:hypothetical protein
LEIDRDGVKRAILNPPFAHLADRSIGLTENSSGQPDNEQATAHSRSPRRDKNRNPGTSRRRGSNLTLMAEKEGFEPSMEAFTPITP